MYIVKDFKKFLKDFEPFVTGADKNGRLWLHGGNNEQKKLDTIKVEGGTTFGLRVREAWANWLYCVVLQYVHGQEITFSDDETTDGFIINKTTKEFIVTEHVAAMDFPTSKLPKGEDRIIQAIEHKVKKDEEYAKGKHLIVFMDGAGLWYPNKVGRRISGKHNFETVTCIGLLTGDETGYRYGVTQFYANHSPCWEVYINADFTDWSVKQIQ